MARLVLLGPLVSGVRDIRSVSVTEDGTMQGTVVMPTVGEIARRLGEPLHRIEYIVRARKIQPSGRAGNARVFTDADVEQIDNELRRIDAENDRGQGP